MNQKQKDDLLLHSWAGVAVQSVAEGYAYIASNRAITIRAAKRQVHAALERRGTNPHISHNVINAWVRLHREYAKTGDIQ